MSYAGRLSLRCIVLTALLTLACAHTSVPLPATPVATAGDPNAQISRGEYIVRNVAVCGGCHSAEPNNPDGPLSGGREFHDWRIGTARAANLTSDNDSGLGSWSEAEIVRALRTGVRKDGRLLAPVMPYAWFNGMSDDDAFAVARYLKSLPPVANPVKQNPNLVFKIGKAMFLKPMPANSINAPPAGPTAAYGSYLSQHAGLCAECHTPRAGIKNAADKSQLFAGDAHPSKEFPANPANITPDTTTGIGNWSVNDFLETIHSGINPARVRLSPFMPWHQAGRMKDDDLRAIYAFLRTVPAIHNAVPRRSGP